jgi:hypothetical protein
MKECKALPAWAGGVCVVYYVIEVKEMELVEIRQELEKMAKRLAAFRGSL